MVNGNGWRRMLTPAVLLMICLGIFSWLEGRVSATEKELADQGAEVSEVNGKLSLLLDHFGIVSAWPDMIIDTVTVFVPFGPMPPESDSGDSL